MVQSSAAVHIVVEQDHVFAVKQDHMFAVVDGVCNSVMLGHSSVVVDNSAMLDHSSVGVDISVMLGHSSVGVGNSVVLDYSFVGVDNSLMLGHSSVGVGNSVVLDHGSVGVDNFVEAHSSFHPLAWVPDYCRRNFLEGLTLDFLGGHIDQDFFGGLALLLDFFHTVLVEVEG